MRTDEHSASWGEPPSRSLFRNLLGVVGLVGSLSACGVLGLAAAPALAGQTTIHQNPSEMSLDAPGGILDALYGLSNLTRVEDFGSSPNDQIFFQVMGGSATAEARFAGLTHRFGYFDGSGSTFTQLFQVSGTNGILTNGPSATFSVVGPTFRFGLQAVSGSTVINTWSSQPSENSDGAKDHMVAWRIAGLGDRYAVAWEDLSIGSPSATEPDYNDLVIEVEGVAPYGCGNGAIDPGEQCDDGNSSDGDCCSQTCQAVANDTSCSDANLCNGGETCQAGACTAGISLVCNDGNGCTDDSCNPASGCVVTNNSASCDDGLFCNGTDTCSGGSCGHAGDPCTSGAECANACNETAGNCFVGAGTTCTDDGNICTTNACNGAGSCAATNNTAACDDGSACTFGDSCSSGSCQPGGSVNCDDADGCTADSCNAATGCEHVTSPSLCPVATEPVQPILECVVENGPGDFTAHFGHLNENAASVTIPVGLDNHFTPPPLGRGQTTTFPPGRSLFYPDNAFQVDFDGNDLTWVVKSPNGTTLSTIASASSTRCPEPPTLLRQYSICYSAVNQIGGPKPAILPLQSVEDLFASQDFDLKRTLQLCAPVDVTYAGQLNLAVSPETHLQARELGLTRTVPPQTAFNSKDPANQAIRVDDIFGSRLIDITRFEELMLPAAICNPSIQSCPADPATLSLNGVASEEFKCYRARPSAGSPRFPRDVRVSGVDPFQSRVYRVTGPKMLCTRANREDADPPASSDAEGLLCYGLSVPSLYCEPGSPPPYALASCRKDVDCGGGRCVHLPRPLLNKWILGVRTRSESTAQILTTLHPKVLCAPAQITP